MKIDSDVTNQFDVLFNKKSNNFYGETDINKLEETYVYDERLELSITEYDSDIIVITTPTFLQEYEEKSLGKLDDYIDDNKSHSTIIVDVKNNGGGSS